MLSPIDHIESSILNWKINHFDTGYLNKIDIDNIDLQYIQMDIDRNSNNPLL